MESQFGAHEVPQGVDPLSAKKLALRVEETLTKHCLLGEPKQLEPPLVLVAPTNRDGGLPNVQHAHSGVLQSCITKGIDKQNGLPLGYASSTPQKKQGPCV